jgi:heme/copper-type cytochrome/quinol oxidase subunit 4
MKACRGDRPVVVWIALCALTVLSMFFVESDGWWRAAAPVPVVLIAAAKSRLVILNFMEARNARPHWRFLYEAWTFAAAATIIIGCLMS